MIKKLFDIFRTKKRHVTFDLKCISGRLNRSGKVYNGDTQKSHYIYHNPRTKELEEKVRRKSGFRGGRIFF
jgi:hypothetical protein